MKPRSCFIVGLITLSVVSGAWVYAAAPVAPPAPAGAAAARGAPATQPAGAPAARSGRRGRGPVNLGPVPDIHAPVASTLPGLLGKPLKWKSTGVLVSPVNDASHFLYSVKDPTIIFHDNRWIIYATANMFSGDAARAMLN